MSDELSGNKIWLRILKLAKPETKTLLWGTFFLAISSGAGLAYPQMVRGILDDALATRSLESVNRASLLIWAAFIVQGLASSVRYYLFTLAGERIVLKLRGQLYAHILDQEVAFFDLHRTGDLMSRLSSDATVLQNAVSVNISMGLRNLASGIGGLAMMIYTSPKLALAMFIVVPPIGVGIAFYGRKIRTFSKKTQEALGDASNVSEETISGLRTVRSFAQENYEKSRYDQSLARSLETAKGRIKEIANFMNLAFFVGFTAVSAVIWFGGRQVVQGELTVGELMQFLIYLLILAFSVGSLGGLWGDLMAAVGAAKRVFDILDKKPEVDLSAGRRLDVVHGEVNFKEVHFHYPTRPDVEVLKGVNFVLKPGMTMALVGQSGSGKSSIASLLARMYDPQKGTISVDGVDIKELEPNWLRRQIGVVSQEPVLISASIEENILYGSQQATTEQMQKAAREANAEIFIKNFPEGYKTLVGERGIQLSGGQKQRVAIARAILKDPKILILDEATSALDTESEALVQEALHRLMQGRTTLVIAHRLATIKDADLILVMNQGEIVEMGQHSELLERKDSVYKKLVERQV
jgi:ABC transporter fused permease/ATP-binding protein